VLGHYSISKASYPSPGAKLSLSAHCLNQLETLCALSHFIHILLQSTPLPNLHHINIGPEVQMDYHTYRKFHKHGTHPKVHAKVETPFDFAAINRVLAMVNNCGYFSRGPFKLGLTLPGASVVKKWLMDHRLGLTLSIEGMHVNEISITVECSIPLDPSATLILVDWIMGCL
jgi:hypothetical protein